MSDIVMRLRSDVARYTTGPLIESQNLKMQAADEIERLRVWNAEMVAKATSGGTLDGYRELGQKCAGLEAKNERLREALHQIKQWADAYPPNIFRPMKKEDWDKAHNLLTGSGVSLDRISGDNMRHVAKGVGEIATKALAARKDHE